MTQLTKGRFYKLGQIAHFTGIPTGTLRAACHRGDLPFIRTTAGASAPILVKAEDVSAWLEACKSNSHVLSPSQTKLAQLRAGDD